MNILILDDHPLFADAMRQVLLRLGNHVSVHIADSVNRALAFMDNGKTYDLILLDLILPGLDGFAFLRVLHDRLVSSPVIVVSASQDAQQIRRAVEAGAMGYIHKSSDAKAMLGVIHQVMAGNLCCPERGKSEPIRFPTRPAAATSPTSVGISERQFEILQCMEKGFSNKGIADELEIAESTVKAHVSRLIEALAVHNRLACVMEAQRLGIL
ncbi:MAG: DNA-binding response regulator [Thiothrix lacustris]|uniref:DNA-binding response regulator n=1 Tax=Thiothrix lacustris TaxID=525917 RepID=A0A1Y1QIJ7_9GAMM|nr:MAG: DNA-binding response regulator [Thiothrix lacustris]